MKLRKLGLVISLPLLLTLGCSKNPSVQEESTSQEAQKVDATSQEQQNLPSEVEVTKDSRNQPKNVNYFSDEDFMVDGVSSKDYKDINQLGSSDPTEMRQKLTKFIIANNQQYYSDEDKLSLLSNEYREEHDGFKKQDLAKKLLPEIDKDLESYEEVLLVKVPIIDEYYNFSEFYENQKLRDNYDFHIQSRDFSLTRYDFDKKGFPATSCQVRINSNPSGFEDDKAFVRNMVKDSHYGKYDCFVKVDNEDLAREIESLISGNKLVASGEVYYKAEAQKNGQSVIFTPILAKVNYVNTENNKIVFKDERYFDKSLFS